MTEATAAALACPACAEPIGAGDEFCEACGHRLHDAAPEVTNASELACPNCGAAASAQDADGYCLSCGHRRPAARDHLEIVVDPAAAAVSDKGRHHHRNEDAVALNSVAGMVVLAVCDGVTHCANGDQASAAAVAALSDHIVAGLTAQADVTPDGLAGLVGPAVTAAQDAVVAVPRVEPGGYPEPPSATLVAAIVGPDLVVVANVGDSRCYWVDAAEIRQLTVDDSLAQEAIADGTTPADAYAASGAHTLTRWLGADATELAPHVTTFVPQRAGQVVVCSDGLWNYFEAPESFSKLVRGGAGNETTLEAARRLVGAALDAGGVDNVTVAIARVTPTAANPREVKE